MGFKARKRISKMASGLLILAYFFVAITKCKGQEQNRCASKQTCAECIGEDPTCAWCSQEVSMDWEKPRCDTIKNLKNGICNEIVNPRNYVKKIKDERLSVQGTPAEEAVQIKPQMIEVHLRPNSVQTFSVTYRQAVDYPVDLYLLMDLSYTMRDDLNNLARLGQTLGKEMQLITSDFRLGFGSFVDKVVAPFSRTHPQWIQNPCKNQGRCVKSYSFKNHMPLSSDITEFVDKVSGARVSANVDTPEGTLEAIMQAMVCKDEIGWRPKSRKLIVIATDEDFHYAGDGKLGGVIKPNDCECHLDSNGIYTKGGQLDYPSLNQMKKKIKENNVYLIFAVPRNRLRHYQILNTRLTATTVGRLEKDSSNIVTLIKEQYDKISSTIEMTETAQGPHNILFSYHSECLEGTRRARKVCRDIKQGDTVTFDVSVGISMCPENEKDWRKSIEIHPIGLSDSLTVKFTMICRCECAQKAGKEEEYRNKWCSGKGTYECGVCQCDDEAYGMSCQCDAKGNQTQSDSSVCKYGSDVHECSSRGKCECGKCVCEERDNPEEKYSGKYCECSNFNCYQRNQKMCNGQGTCVCGKCKCKKGWAGPDCGCIDSPENCILQNGADVCSGHGKCNCGICICEENYYGPFCDDCLICQGKCEKYGDCVECVLSAKEEGIRPECRNCEDATVELTDKIEVNETLKEKVCFTQDKDGCKISFKYIMNDYNDVTIQAQITRECPKPVDVLLIASSTAGGVLIAGLLALLLVKILTEVHDRREWAKFQKDLDRCQWDSGNNPIFIEPTSTFENPAFGDN